ncbi:MAG: DinB family protein [Dehalococcoidales bacterium]|nr:MAG: DinB family protein [Dehalococcoidales bacterium]
MDAAQYTLGILTNLQEALTRALDGLTQEEISYQPDQESNSIGFILWHQIRAEDMMVVATLMDKPEEWETGKWAARMKFDDDFRDNGWGYTAEQVSSFVVPKLEEIISYGKAVRTETEHYIAGLTPSDFDEVKTTLFGEMAVSMILTMLIGELALHTGHITYVRGLQRGLDK